MRTTGKFIENSQIAGLVFISLSQTGTAHTTGNPVRLPGRATQTTILPKSQKDGPSLQNLFMVRLRSL